MVIGEPEYWAPSTNTTPSNMPAMTPFADRRFAAREKEFADDDAPLFD
jgi:hypothetical protein